MKQTLFVLIAFLFILGCDLSSGQNDFPAIKDIKSLEFYYINVSLPPGSFSYSLTLDMKESGVLSGAALFSDGTTTCDLALNLTESESTDIRNYIKAARYCTYISDVEMLIGASTNAVSVSLNTGADDIVVFKEKPVNGTNINYFCDSQASLYILIKGIVASNSDIATCPSDWSDWL